MKKLLKHIAVIITSVLLVCTAGGIGLYQHYCLCTGNTFQSVLIPATCCEHTVTGHCDPDLINREISDCCTSATIGNKDAAFISCSHEDCCSDEFLFLKTDSFEYTKSLRQTAKFILAVQSIFYDLIDPLTSAAGRRVLAWCSNDLPPPPLFGRELLSSIHQLKLDIPLV
ncbi:MAG: hypothetical protein ACNA7V_08590 [Bacteroidales bacterium]